MRAYTAEMTITEGFWSFQSQTIDSLSIHSWKAHLYVSFFLLLPDAVVVVTGLQRRVYTEGWVSRHFLLEKRIFRHDEQTFIDHFEED
jgi:hypothetical protein